MPKEHKKRGRREEKKRKREAEEQEELEDTKKRRLSAHEADGAQDIVLDDVVAGVSTPAEMPFYGMLDEEEQEYFKRADEMLELNQFDSPEERSLFLENVYKEAEGKELKIANSQSCSRLMERLILLSTPEQLKALFQKFSGQYVFYHCVFPDLESQLNGADFCRLCNIDSPPIAAKHCFSMPPRLLRKR
jgi:nucleolar protein 9